MDDGVVGFIESGPLGLEVSFCLFGFGKDEDA